MATEREDAAAHRKLRAEYAGALRAYLSGAGEAPLERAYVVGRRALGDGIGVLGLVALHEAAVERLLRERPHALSRAGLLSASAAFLAEGLSPFEMTHRGYQEAVTALRDMNQRLEDEARRIAHALHDDAGQLLVSVHLALAQATAGMPARARARFDGLRNLLDEVEQHLRRLSHELRPTILDDLGLQAALDWLAQGLATRAGLEVRVEGSFPARLTPARETALYRAAQEALRNAIRHAGATTIRVHLEERHGGLRLAIRDDGRGFDAAATGRPRADRGLGLAAMRERVQGVGGELRIDSSPGRGTEVTITIPLREANDADTAAAGR